MTNEKKKIEINKPNVFILCGNPEEQYGNLVMDMAMEKAVDYYIKTGKQLRQSMIGSNL